LPATDQYTLGSSETRTAYNRFGDVIQSATVATRSVSEGSGTELVWLLSRTLYDSLGRAEYTTDRFELPYIQDAQPGATGSPTAASPPVYATRTIYDDQTRVVQTQRLKDVIVTITDPIENPEAQIQEPGALVSTTQTIYNTKGQVSRSIAADGQITDQQYDSLGRQTTTIGHPVPAESVGLAQHAGYLVRHRSQTVYDTQGRVAAQHANIVQVEDAAGNLIAIDDSAAQTTSYGYDPLGNRTSTTFTDGSYIIVRYDDFGRQTAEMQQTEGLYLVDWSAAANSFVVTGWDADGDGQPDATQPPDALDLGTPVSTRLLEYDTQGRLVAVVLPAVPDPQNDNQLTRPRYEYG
jgi:YD repeat-containing protein